MMADRAAAAGARDGLQADAEPVQYPDRGRVRRRRGRGLGAGVEQQHPALVTRGRQPARLPALGQLGLQRGGQHRADCIPEAGR